MTLTDYFSAAEFPENTAIKTAKEFMYIITNKILVIFVSAVFTAAVILSCGNPPDKISHVMHTEGDKNSSGKTLYVMGDHDFPPFEFIDENGNPSGFNIEIFRSLSRVMNLNVKIQLAPWRDVREKLEKREIDVIMGMYKTSERDKKADFTIPHFITSYVIYIREGGSVKSYIDLTGKDVIVQNGDLGHDYLINNNIQCRIIVKRDWSETLSALAAGEGDCAIVSFLQGEILRKKLRLKNLRVIGDSVLQQRYCIAVKEGDAELLEKLNEGLSLLKSTGEYDAIYDKWFGLYEKRVLLEHPAVKAGIIVLIILSVFTAGIYAWNRSLQNKVKEKTEELKRELEKSKEIKALLEEALEESSRAEEAALISRTESEKANEAKSVFLAGVSHELRTPLNGIIGMSQLLEATPLTDEQKGLLEMLRLSSDNLLRILTDLVDYTRIGSGKFRLEISSVNLDEFAGNIAPVMEMMAREKGLDFRMKRGGPGVTLMTDRDRISQIIFNLVNNSVKYTREGSVTLDVHYNNSLVISVSDTGVGIAPDKMKEIFKPFAQIKGEGEAKNRGLGLGLSIVRLIVKMMDGAIDVVSKQGMGSTFTVKIPCVARFDENTISANEEVVIEDDYTATETISVLIVEDEVINRIFLERILTKRGFVIDSALNGRECLEKYRTGNYDLIFMDINMPEIDGFEAVSLIREEERFNGRSRTPVIAVTAHVYPDDIKKCMDAGMDSYIAKPYDTMKLMEEIIKVCSKAKHFIRNNYPRN